MFLHRDAFNMKDLGMVLENPEMEQSHHDVDAEKMSDFNLESWTKIVLLLEKLLKFLERKSWKHKRLLLRLKKDLCELEILVGQRKLLINAVARLGGAIQKHKSQETSDSNLNIHDIRQ